MEDYEEPRPTTAPASPTAGVRSGRMGLLAVASVVALGTALAVVSWLLARDDKTPTTAEVAGRVEDRSDPSDNDDTALEDRDPGGTEARIIAPPNIGPGDAVTFGFELNGFKEIGAADLLINGVVVSSADRPENLEWIATEGQHDVALRITTPQGQIVNSERVQITVDAPLTTVAPSTNVPSTVAPAAPVLLSPSQFHATASSVLPPTSAGEYWVSHLFDSNSSTAWNHDSGSGSPEDQWLLFELTDPTELDRIVITNGYVKSPTVFFNNHRAERITIEIASTSGEMERFDFTLSDIQTPQALLVQSEFAVRTIRISFDSVYRGARYNDLAISRVELWGLP